MRVVWVIDSHTAPGLSFKNQGEYDHPRSKFVDRIGVNQIGIAVMYVYYSIADFQFRGKNKYREKELETDTGLNTPVIRIEFYQIVCLSRRGIGRKIILIIYARQDIEPEILHTIRKEFHL